MASIAHGHPLWSKLLPQMSERLRSRGLLLPRSPGRCSGSGIAVDDSSECHADGKGSHGRRRINLNLNAGRPEKTTAKLSESNSFNFFLIPLVASGIRYRFSVWENSFDTIYRCNELRSSKIIHRREYKDEHTTKERSTVEGISIDPQGSWGAYRPSNRRGFLDVCVPPPKKT